MNPLPRLARWYLRWSLGRACRRIRWWGDWPRVPPDRAVVLVANHHAYYDGAALLLLAQDVLHRRPVVWMEEYDRYRFLRPFGTRAFPVDQPGRRVRTIRETARRLKAGRSGCLVYFPEGRLHDPREGLLPVPPDRFRRLDRVLGRPLWLPVAIRMETWREARPVMEMIARPPRSLTDADPWSAVAELLARLESGRDLGQPGSLLEGRRSPDERWGHRPAGPAS